ncbi:MAG TPA: hypothetical protein VKW04_13350 [Planctomycetota bacterium]|nr:hypothetical protein [Planctomycetota bacterium]
MISHRGTERLSPPEAAMSAARTRGRRGRGRGRPGRPARHAAPERTLQDFLMENSAALTFFGISLGVFVSRRFFALPLAVAAMLAQESLGTVGLARVKRTVRG